MTGQPSVSDEPRGRCAVHPELEAAGLCSRCGSYFCGDCADRTGVSPLCAACATRAGANGLAETRQKCWGKRDAWVWLFGFLGSVGGAFSLAMMLSQGHYASSIAIAVDLVISIAYFMLLRWARRAMFVMLLVGPLASLLGPIETFPGLSAEAAVAFRNLALIASTGVSALLLSIAYRSPRNKLAFRIEIPEHELREVRRKHASAHAVRALVYGLLSIPVPLLGIAGIVFAVVTLRKLARSTEPPGNRKLLAILGLVLSSFSTLVWLLAFAALVMAATRM